MNKVVGESLPPSTPQFTKNPANEVSHHADQPILRTLGQLSGILSHNVPEKVRLLLKAKSPGMHLTSIDNEQRQRDTRVIEHVSHSKPLIKKQEDLTKQLVEHRWTLGEEAYQEFTKLVIEDGGNLHSLEALQKTIEQGIELRHAKFALFDSNL